jgi:hypothetical protein
MIASRTDARDRMLSPLKTVADAQSLYAIWDDSAKAVPKDTSVKWVRVSVKHRAGDRTSLGRADGKGKHTLSGFVFVEIFTPRDDGLVSSDVLSAAFADTFRNPADGDIWYRSVAELEMGESDGWFKTDVVAEFEYDLIQ